MLSELVQIPQRPIPDLTHLNTEILHPGDIIIRETVIKERVQQLSHQIAEDYRDKNLLMIALLKGAGVLQADLLRGTYNAGLYDVEVDNMTVTSYGAGTRSSGVVEILRDITVDPSGRNVLLVDDIGDTLLTIDEIAKYLQARNVGSLSTLVLLDKPASHKINRPITYVGFNMPDEFYLGYGMDFNQRWRGCPDIIKGPL